MKKIITIDYNKIFTPDLSPKEMLELGVFGGYYFKNNFLEFPKSWFKNAKISTDKFDVNMNYKYFMDQQMLATSQKYQLPSNPLLNPFAWVKFIKAIKRGDFKKKD